MQFYNLALQPSTAIIKAVYGNFTTAKSQQILLAKSKSIQLYVINQSGIVLCHTYHSNFQISWSTSLLTKTSKDLLIVGSDSGKVIILEYDQHRRRFLKTHEETFGKSGCRRIVPGQYIAVDPRGRAFMIAAIEKQKFVYTLNRQNEKLSISSPRDAHKSHTLCIALTALDMRNDNAVFACLEIDYGEVQDKESLINQGGIRKVVAYYQMDFGMNTVIRKKQLAVDSTAHMLISVPDLPQGPGGLIILLEDYLIYRTFKDQQIVRFPLFAGRPSNRKTQFTAYTTYRQKGTFFFLISSELGDIFKVQFMLRDQKDTKQVLSIKIQYFDTVSCLNSMCLTKNGYLFCASEKQDHILYKFGEKQDNYEPIYTHSQMPNNNMVQFHRKLQGQKELFVEDTIEQYGPTTDLKVIDLKGDNNPQIYMINGSGVDGKNYLRIIKQGLRVKEIIGIKYNRGQDMWSLKGSYGDQYHKMIIISLKDKTIVLTISDNTTFAQTKDTGIDQERPTIHIGRLEDDSIVQVLPNGFRHIRSDNTVKEIKFEDTKIIKGTTRGGQMVIAFAGGDIFYYQLNKTGMLEERASQTSLDSQVVALDLAPIQKGRSRSNFFVAAFTDYTTRIFQLGSTQKLQILSIQNMHSSIQSLVIQEMDSNEDQYNNYRTQLYLYAGLGNGMLIRTSVDTITGKLNDSRSKYLGSKPVKCVKLKILGKPAILALSSRPWLIYTYGIKQMTTLLAYPYLDIACSLQLKKNPHCIIGFCQNSIKAISLQSFGKIFHSDKIQLQYSAKKMMVFKNKIAIIESDQKNLTVNSMEEENLKNKKYWVSQVRIYNPIAENQKNIINDFQPNQVCMSMCYYENQENKESYLLFGCIKNLVYHPKLTMQQASIKVYLWKNETSSAIYLYKTQVEDIPLVLHSWKNKILAGIGNCLRAYQIGKKKLLRKAQLKNLTSPINTIKSMGHRIFATEVGDSFHLYKYEERQQTFYDIADDILPRYVTVSALLDYHTVMGADKFENIFVSRVPQNAQEDVDNNPNSYKFRYQNGYLNGAPFKMQQICSFYVGQVITSIQKSSLATTGSQIIIYSTINGGIGALCLFQTREDVDFFTHLEMYLRNLTPMLGGRDHLMYRSYYAPCKAVVDGDLCQVYMKLTYEEQVEIGKHLDRTPQQIIKKLQQMRNRLI